MDIPDCSAEPTCPLAVSLETALSRCDCEAITGMFPTGRYHCRYLVWGDGPPLLLIPGIANDARSFVLLMARLASHFRCIAYDLPAGRADGARLAAYTHADLVDDALVLLDSLGVGESYVFGSSFGSTVALEAARRAPRRFLRIILQGGFARRPLAPAEVLLARLARYWPGSLRMVPFRNTVLKRGHFGPFADGPPEAWNYFLERSNAVSIRTLAYRALMVQKVDLRPELKDIRQPVLLVCGDEDPLISSKCEAELLEGLPNAGRVVLSHCGHNALFSHPDMLAEVVRRFLTPAN